MRILHQGGWQAAAAVTGCGNTGNDSKTKYEPEVKATATALNADPVTVHNASQDASVNGSPCAKATTNLNPETVPVTNDVPQGGTSQDASQDASHEPCGWWTKRELRYNDFKWMKPLGSGQFGRVFKAREKVSGERKTVAVKVVPKELLDEDEADRQCEGLLHARVHHENIIELLATFEDSEKQYLVLEHAVGGTLYSAQQSTRAKRFDERTTASYMRQLASALSACHKQGVVHRDLKPENVVLDDEGNAKLCDFGWAMGIDGSTERCGTLDYFSPQMVLLEKYARDVDAWALGVLAFEMLTGNPPFERVGEQGDYEIIRQNTMKRIVDIDYQWPSNIPLSRDVKHLVDGLLRFNQLDRFDMNDVLRHPWIIKHHKKAMRNQ